MTSHHQRPGVALETRSGLVLTSLGGSSISPPRRALAPRPRRPRAARGVAGHHDPTRHLVSGGRSTRPSWRTVRMSASGTATASCSWPAMYAPHGGRPDSGGHWYRDNAFEVVRPRRREDEGGRDHRAGCWCLRHGGVSRGPGSRHVGGGRQPLAARRSVRATSGCPSHRPAQVAERVDRDTRPGSRSGVTFRQGRWIDGLGGQRRHGSEVRLDPWVVALAALLCPKR